jgi:hypothetical protein
MYLYMSPSIPLRGLEDRERGEGRGAKWHDEASLGTTRMSIALIYFELIFSTHLH